MPSPPVSSIPAVLFPLKIETRFVKEELWIRVFPDEAFLQGHNPRLSQAEREDAQAFKQMSTPEEKRAAWEELVSKYGVYRSSWLVQITETALQAQQVEATEHGELPADEEPTFYFKWLPDKLVVFLYRKNQPQSPVRVEGSLIDRAGITVFGKDDEWVSDFDLAVSAGMGFKINLNAIKPAQGPIDTAFEKVIVTGIRYAEDPLVPAKGLADLFHNHQYTEGFSFLKYGTPTNNTENEKSGFTAKDEYDAAASFEYSVNGLSTDDATAGGNLAKGLGLEATLFRHTREADLTEPELNTLFQKASWFALGGLPLFMLFGEQISSESHEAIWNHYVKYVKAKGQFNAIKVGNQPYGILPVMSIRGALEDQTMLDSEEITDKMAVYLARLFNRWVEMANADGDSIPRLGDENDSYLEILKILSMQEYSETFQIRPLEYDQFKGKLQSWLQERGNHNPVLATIIQSNASLYTEYQDIQRNIASLIATLGINPSLENALALAPLLSFKDGSKPLIQFENGKLLLTDEYGEELPGSDQDQQAFSLTQEDLTQFLTFIDALEENDDTTLIQYTEALSVFTDLFLRSYNYSTQLYYRNVYFEPTVEALSGNPFSFVESIQQAEGATVEKGDAILVIISKKNLNSNQSINTTITAPFSGKLEKIAININDSVYPGKTLFILKNEEKRQAIKTQYISLGRQIVAECNAITDLKEREHAQLEALREAIDLNSFRLDAWLTSLANQRLDLMRNRPGYEKGIYFGAYGWVENLTKNTTSPIGENMTGIYREDGGIVHAPNSAQAVAAAVFKNSFLSYRSEQNNNPTQDSNPFTLNLISERLQKSHFLMEGIRQGQHLEALLGYQLERYLHDHGENGLHNEIYQLREAFPLEENVKVENGQASSAVNLTVIDGLKAINSLDHLPASLTNKVVVKGYIEKLADTLDGCLDNLFYEAGYQITQGNLSQAAAALDATKGTVEPPPTEALNTKLPGIGISHKLALFFSPVGTSYPISNSKGFVEPVLEKWLAENLGDLNKIGCQVELYSLVDNQLSNTVNVVLSDLDIGYLDFLYLSDDPASKGASELELRIWNYVQEQTAVSSQMVRYHITENAPPNCEALGHAMEVANYASTLLSKCRHLKSEDVTMSSESPSYDWNALNAIKNERIIPVLNMLKSLNQESLQAANTIRILSKFDFHEAKRALFSEEGISTDKLAKEIAQAIATLEQLLEKYQENMPYHAAFDLLHQASKVLFGQTFLLIPPAVRSPQFTQMTAPDKQRRLVGEKMTGANPKIRGQERIQNWIQGLAQTQENVEAYEDWLMVNNVWKERMSISNEGTYYIAQSLTLDRYPWVALSKQEIDELLADFHQEGAIYSSPQLGETYPLENGNYYPDGCESMVFYMNPGLNANLPIYGLVIEEFSEHIPNEKVDTGLSFHYNAPNTEPPQAILLALHPKSGQESNFAWSEDHLKDILFDTIDLYKVRMVDPEAIQEFGYVLPLAYWMNIPRTL